MSSWSKGLNQFLDSVKPLGLKEFVYSSDLATPNINFVNGVAEVTDLSEVVLDRGPLRGKNGEALVLYIKDHSFKNKISMVLGGDSSEGNRVHLSYCKTLEEMHAKGRYARYHLRHDPDGLFLISGEDYSGVELEGNASLWVCQNCLKQLNYQGFDRIDWHEKTEIIRNFDYDKYFFLYSSFFKKLPKRKQTDSVSYSANWELISKQIRSDVNYCCDDCGINCSKFRHLLHVHHRNGVKSDNSKENLQPLCLSCHKRQPHHEHMTAKKEDEDTLTKLRKEQGLDKFDYASPKKKIKRFIKLIDPALEEPFRLLSSHYSVDDIEISYEHFEDNERLFVASFAFVSEKIGVSVEFSELEKKQASLCRWRLMSYSDVMSSMCS